MKAIIIKESNRARIEALCEKANGAGKARLLDYDSLVKAVERVYRKFDLPKKALHITVEYDCGAEKYPSAYKWSARSTQATILFRNGNAYLTDICRDTAHMHTDNCFNVTYMGDTTREALINRYSKF